METNQEEANKAFSAFKSALKAGNVELARVLILNAITHCGSLEYLDAYVDFTIQNCEVDKEGALAKAYDILSMAALNGPVDDIEQIQLLINRLQEFEFSRESETGRHAHKDVVTQEVVEELESYSWENYRKCGWLFSEEKLQEKESGLKQALESGLLDDAKADEYFHELTEVQWQIAFCGTRLAFYDSEKETECELKKEAPLPQRVGALMAKTANALNQMWAFSIGGPLSESEFVEELNAAQAKFEAIEPEAQRILSEKAHNAVVSLEMKYRDVPGEMLTPRIELLQKKVVALQELLPQMTYKPYRDEVINRIKTEADKITLLTRLRFARYQQMAADRALQAIKTFDGTRIVWEKGAIQILDECRLAEVDESLLSPEAASMFQTAKSMLTAKITDKTKRAEYEHKCVVSPKFKLEQY